MHLRTKQKLDKWLGGFLVAVNLAAAKALGFILKRNHTLVPGPKNILFIKIMGFGSLLAAADAIQAVKEKYPGARLILLGNTQVTEGIKLTELFDEYWTLNDKAFFQTLTGTIKFLYASWQKKQLWVCNLEVYSKLTSVFSLWTCARNRFDFFFNEVLFRKNLNTHPVYFNQFALVSENYNRMAEAMGAPVDKEYTFKSFPQSARQTPENRYIFINNTCSELAKERLYPMDQLLTLCTQLYKKYQYTLVFTGAEEDVAYYNEVIKKLSPEILVQNIAGKYSLTSFIMKMYKECFLLITVDSGPMHYAQRLGIPMISLWGPTNPNTRIKENPFSATIYLGVPCSPCVHHTEILPCGGNNFCMKNISPAIIIQTAEKLLSNLPS